jgi:hypothetical protein
MRTQTGRAASSQRVRPGSGQCMRARAAGASGPYSKRTVQQAAQWAVRMRARAAGASGPYSERAAQHWQPMQ